MVKEKLFREYQSLLALSRQIVDLIAIDDFEQIEKCALEKNKIIATINQLLADNKDSLSWDIDGADSQLYQLMLQLKKTEDKSNQLLQEKLDSFRFRKKSFTNNATHMKQYLSKLSYKRDLTSNFIDKKK